MGGGRDLSSAERAAIGNVRVLPWPALSPDLNPIENLWGVMTQRVFGHGKQYFSGFELKEAVLEAWDAVTLDECLKLVGSMPKRCKMVVEGKGKPVDY
jgi:hypothetical protein